MFQGLLYFHTKLRLFCRIFSLLFCNFKNSNKTGGFNGFDLALVGVFLWLPKNIIVHEFLSGVLSRASGCGSGNADCFAVPFEQTAGPKTTTGLLLFLGSTRNFKRVGGNSDVSS